MSAQPRILVIKLSALGDFVQALGPFAAIRAHHPDARITLLTTKPYVALAKASPYFDEVWVDRRPKPWDVPGMLHLRKMLRSSKFQMVYDLQTSERSSRYFHLVVPETPWSGIASGASHPHANPDRNMMHTLERQADQLRMAGIPETPAPDLSWVQRDLRKFHLPQKFALMVPGGAAHRTAKRWPADRYAAIARMLGERGIASVLIGTEADHEAIDAVLATSKTAMSLVDHTDLLDIPAIARLAWAALGNDTGPMHLAATAGCRSVVLFSEESDPALCAPRGRVAILRKPDLATLDVGEVWAALEKLTSE
jgi:ADP-heptose:LPS heptosyltransferase